MLKINRLSMPSILLKFFASSIILSLFTAVLVFIPSFNESDAFASEINLDPRINNAPVLFKARASHSDLGLTPEPKIIIELTDKFLQNEDYAYQELHLFNTKTGVLQDSTYPYGDSEVEFDISKFADQGVHNYQVYLVDYLAGETIDTAENIIGKSNVVSFKREKPISITLWTDPWDGDVRFHDSYYSLDQEMNGDDYAAQLFNVTMDTRASYDLNWWGTSKAERLDYIDFHQTGAVHNFVAVLRPLDDSCGPHCYEDEWEENYKNKKYSDVNDAVASSSTITVKRNPWSVEIKESVYSDLGIGDDISVEIERGGGDYAIYLVEDATGNILEISTYHQGDVYMMGQPNPNHPDLDWLTAYVAWDYEELDGVKPTKLSDLKHIIANNKNIKDIALYYTDKKAYVGNGNKSIQCNINCVGDPINNFTGEFFDNKEDILATSNSLSTTFERSFSTFNRDSVNSLGLGWRSNYEMKIKSGDETNSILKDSKTLEIENENGSITTFYLNSDGLYTPLNSATLATLKFDTNSNDFIYERKNGEGFKFNSSGALIEKFDDRGNTVNLTYNSSGKLTKVSDNYLNEITLNYNAQNLISSIGSNFGKSSAYIYDSKKRLTSATNDKGVTFLYTHDSGNRIKTFTNELGGKTTNTYDTYTDQTIKQVDPLGRATNIEYEPWYGNERDAQTVITYPNGNKVAERYVNGELLRKIEGYETENEIISHYSYSSTGFLVSEAIEGGPVTSHLYDDRGNKTKEIDSLGNSINFEYDDQDNLIKITDPYDNETTNTYDSKTNLLSSTDPLGNKTTFTYDTQSNLTKVTDARGNKTNANPADYTSTLSYTSKGLLSSVTDPLSKTSNFNYDTKGQLTRITDAKNNQINSQYGSLELPTKVIDPLQNETTLTYDQMGNTLTSKNAIGAITTYTYDLFGNMLTSKNSLNEIASYTYDKMDKLTKITLPSGETQQIKYDLFSRPTQFTDGLGKITKQAYNKASQVTSTTDQMNSVTKYSYDGNGNIFSITNPDKGVTYYSYDKNSNLHTIIDPLERVTEYFYDANDRLIEEKKADGTSVKTAYDEVGNVTKTTDEKGKEKHYTFDALNRQTSYTNENDQTVSYSYDANSNLTTQTRTDDSIVNYDYDERDLLVKIDYPGAADDVVYVYDSIGRKTSEKKGADTVKTYNYDSLNRITEQGETGNKVSYSYDNSGDLTKLTYPSGRTVDYNYSLRSDLTSLTSGAGISSDFTYNNRGQETQASIINGIIEKTGYDSNGRLNSMSILDNTAASLYKRTHKFNTANEVSERGTSVNGSALNIDKFKYDVTSKLTGQNKASDNSVVNNYSYGDNGTLNSINEKEQIFDDAGKITSSGNSTFNYDSRNSRVEIIDLVDSTKNISYEWTVENFLKKVEIGTLDSNLNNVEYDYDSSGLLKSRTENSNTDDFVWDINREIPALLSDGEYEYIYKAGERTPFAQVNIDTDEIEYLHSDLNGSILAATDEAGDLVDTVEYSPYGETTDNPVSNFGYAGEWIDQTTGYSYNKARWLDISTGTFLSEDPLVQMTKNAFGYVEGNPLTQIDPLGLFSWGDAFGSVGDFIYENSTEIGLGLTGVGLAVSATAIGAPVGILITVAGMSVSGYAAARDISTGNTEGAIVNALGVIPGVKVISSTAKISRTIKGSSTLVNKGVIKSRKELKKYNTEMNKYNKSSLKTWNNTSTAMSAVSGIDMIHDKIKESRENSCK